MNRHALLAFAALFALGCQDLPTEPELEITEPPAELPLRAARSVVPTFSCTRSWAAAVDGDWYDAGKWSPAGVPLPGDNVCLDVPGTYEVVLDYDALAHIVKVGGPGATVTLAADHSLLVDGGILVEATGRLEIDGAQTIHLGSSEPSPTVTLPDAEWFVNRGVVEIGTGCACASLTEWEFQTYENHAWMYLRGPSTLQAVTFENRGFVFTRGTDAIDVQRSPTSFGPYFDQLSGTVGGTATVRLWDGTLTWEGGTLPVRTSSPSTATMTLVGQQTELTLQSSVLSGQVDVDVAQSLLLIGTIGRDVRIQMLRAALQLWLVGRQQGLPENEGTLDLQIPAGRAMDLTLFPTTKSGPCGLVNRGTLSIHGGGAVSARPVFACGGRPVVTNRGTIDVQGSSALQVTDMTLAAASNSTQRGTLTLVRSTLLDRGTLGDVRSIGSTISPGPVALPGLSNGIGTLSMASLELDANSEVVMDIASTRGTAHDVIDVQGSVQYGGTLTVRTPTGFAGGRCGDLIPLITDRLPQGSARGSFHAYQGLNLGATRGWRVYNPARTLGVAGYHPGSAPLYATRGSIAMQEGGPSYDYQICLGSAVPIADVDLQPWSTNGQLDFVGPLRFGATDWMLPQRMMVHPFDDAVVEGLHADTILHRLVSKDPSYSSAGALRIPVTIEDNDGSADLAMVRVSQQDNQFVGDVMNTVFRVTNAGPTESTGSTVTSTALSGLAFVTATGATCTASAAGVVTCALGLVPAGGQLDFTVSFEGLAAGVHSSTWTVTGQQPDPDPSNDSVDYTQRVN